MDISEIRRINLQTILRDRFQNNQAELARTIGVSPNNICRYFSDSPGYGRTISGKAARDIESATGLPYGWMDSSLNLKGWVSSSSLPLGNDASSIVYVPEASERAVPLVSCPLVEELGFLSSEGQCDKALGWVQSPSLLAPGSYALLVRGDAMQNGDEGARSYEAGSLIFVEPTTCANHGDCVIAILPGSDQPTFKQFAVFENVNYLLTLNSRYPAIEVPDETKIIGVVKER